MKDVASFKCIAHEVSGGSVNFSQDVPESIEVVGRVPHDTAYQYLASTKKIANKEILVVKILSVSDSDKQGYTSLYSYLASKKRLGVIGNCDKTIKDFYLLPLPSHQPIPQVLLPLDGPGFEEKRSNLLVGIIVRPKPKRIYDQFSGTWKDVQEGGKSLSVEGNAMLSELKEASEMSFTPPLPDREEQEVVEITADDDDDCYTPELIADHSSTQKVSLNKNKRSVSTEEDPEAPMSKKVRTDVDLSAEQESMLAELNKQVDRGKKELAVMKSSMKEHKETLSSAQSHSESSVDKQETANKDTAPSIGSIALPTNLQAILDNIKKKEEEIQEKEEEILKRKTAASMDTDMRLMIPQRSQPPMADQSPGMPARNTLFPASMDRGPFAANDAIPPSSSLPNTPNRFMPRENAPSPFERESATSGSSRPLQVPPPAPPARASPSPHFYSNAQHRDHPPPQHYSGPPPPSHSQDGPTRVLLGGRPVPSHERLQGPPPPRHSHDRPPPDHVPDGPLPPHHIFDEPPPSHHMYDEPAPPSHHRIEGPPGAPPHMHDGPPPPHHRHDGPPHPHRRGEGPPPPHHHRRDTPPFRREGPPHHMYEEPVLPYHRDDELPYRENPPHHEIDELPPPHYRNEGGYGRGWRDQGHSPHPRLVVRN